MGIFHLCNAQAIGRVNGLHVLLACMVDKKLQCSLDLILLKLFPFQNHLSKRNLIFIKQKVAIKNVLQTDNNNKNI